MHAVAVVVSEGDVCRAAALNRVRGAAPGSRRHDEVVGNRGGRGLEDGAGPERADRDRRDTAVARRPQARIGGGLKPPATRFDGVWVINKKKWHAPTRPC